MKIKIFLVFLMTFILAGSVFAAKEPHNKIQFQFVSFPNTVMVDSFGTLEICLVNNGTSGTVLYDDFKSFDQVVVSIPKGSLIDDLVLDATGLICTSNKENSWACRDISVTEDEILLALRPLEGTPVTVDEGDAIYFHIENLLFNSEQGVAFLNIDQQIDKKVAHKPLNVKMGIFKATPETPTFEVDPTVDESVKDGVSWGEIGNVPDGFKDGIDDGITVETDPQVGSIAKNRLPKWNGTALVDSVSIIEDESGKVGIGTSGPTSKLTVAGMIESTSEGIKFPDGTVQTTAQLVGPQGERGEIGTGLEYQWDGTKLGVKKEDQNTYSYVDLRGEQGPVGSGSADINVTTYTDVSQYNEILVTHGEDTDGARIVQVVKYLPGYNAIDSSLIFNEANESRFIQEDTLNGTDFLDDGRLTLHNISEVAFTLTTWDISKSSSLATLSNSDLTVSFASGYYGEVQTVHSVSTGKWYWEVRIDGGTAPSNCLIGVEPDDAIYSDLPGWSDGWSYYPLYGTKYPGASLYGSPARTGDVIGIALDMDAGTLEFYKNGVSMGVAFNNISGSVKPYPTVGTGASTQILTANFGQAPFAYSVPDGFYPGLGVGSYEYTEGELYYVTTSDSNHLALANIYHINSCTISHFQPENTTLGILVSFDGRSTWKRWDGSAWTDYAGLDDKSNWSTVAEVEEGLAGMDITNGTHLDFAFLLGTLDRNVSPAIYSITLDYEKKGSFRSAMTDYEYEEVSPIETKVIKLSPGTDEQIKVKVMF